MHRSAKRAAWAAALALVALASAASAQDVPRLGPDSREPVPRYMSLRGEAVNGRRGPGTQHRVDWIYRRAGLPLLVTAESGAWRRVRDPDGAQVWIHGAYLQNRRTVFVRGGRIGSVALRQTPEGAGRATAFLERGVVAELEACRGVWRRVRVDGRAGWTEAQGLWGAETCADGAGEQS